MDLHFRRKSNPGGLLRIVLAKGYPQTKDSPLPRCIVRPEYAGAPDEPIQSMGLILFNTKMLQAMEIEGLQVVFASRTCTNSFRWCLRDRFQIGQKSERCGRRPLHVCLRCTGESRGVQEQILAFQFCEKLCRKLSSRQQDVQSSFSWAMSGPLHNIYIYLTDQ